MNVSKLLNRLAPLLIPLLVLLFFNQLAFTNRILARGDTYAYFYPYWQAAGDALRAGRLPLWNDLLFMGAPFLANSQVGLLYPPNWPLWAWVPDTPTAIKLNILLHLAWAGLGTFALLRVALKLDAVPALLGAALFALGGHLTAHVEQVNQLQGLSWLPWLFLLLDLARQRPLRWTPALGMALALQLLSGHTQTVFIGLAGLSVMALWWVWKGTNRQDGEPGRGDRLVTHWERFAPLMVLLVAAMLAVLMASAQLGPTLQLSGLSNRSGGLPYNEVISFSLPPALVGRALLPGYDTALHSEYAAVMGIAGLALALLGAWAGWRDARWQVWIILAGLGLLLALGGWNPLYWLLGRLPGFNLFRVPARWLALFALAASALAAYAVHGLLRREIAVPRRFALFVGLGVIVLIGAAFLSPLAESQHVAGTVTPSTLALLGWLGSGALVVVALRFAPRHYAAAGLALLALLELLLASALMPYNRLNAPDAFAAQRPAISQLLARQPEENSTAAGRFLSLSDIAFDPGDLAMIRASYGPLLAPEALDDFITTVKMRDVIAPNLGLAWGLPGVDGYDGGVLPLRGYTDFTRLLLDDPPPDGRLRENLPAIPAQRWLDLMGVQYLITDKVGDDWYGGVFYDLQWATPLDGEAVEVGYLPDFVATALGLVYEAGDGAQLAVEARLDGQAFSAQAAIALPQEGRPYSYGVVAWGDAAQPERIALTGEGITVHGAALIDQRSGAFHPLTVTPGGAWRLAHSGDVKIYENLDPAPRAWLVYQAAVLAEDSAVLARMSDPAFDPRTAVILAAGEPLAGQGAGTARIVAYAPERLEIAVTTDADAYLVLSEADYPGWMATLGGEVVPVLRADVMFRAVFIPAGEHTLLMQFAPPNAAPLALAAWGAALLWIVAAVLYARKPASRSRSSIQARSASASK